MIFARSWNYGSSKTWNRNPEPDYGKGNGNRNGNRTWNQISMIVNFKKNFALPNYLVPEFL